MDAFIASAASISLNSHVTYLYISFNISDNVLIGNTEAFACGNPFNPKLCHFVTEKTLESMYVSVLHKRIS